MFKDTTLPLLQIPNTTLQLVSEKKQYMFISANAKRAKHVHSDFTFTVFLCSDELGNNNLGPGLEVIKLFSCSTQLSMKFKLLINTEIAKRY